MPFLLTYWKQLVVGLAILVAIGLIHHKGYLAGEAAVQAKWDAQKVLDVQVATEAANKTATIVANTETETQNANNEFIKSDKSTKDYYTTHSVPGVHYAAELCKSATETNRSKMPSLSNTPRQSEEPTTDTVSRAEYDKLADECLETTIQLDNAQKWAQDQIKIYDTEQ